jgi:hypothetical protein
MKTYLAIALLLVSSAAFAGAQNVSPEKYLKGPVSRDVASAIHRASTENKPIWIIAWDEKFHRLEEPKKDNVADYNLHGFYQNPEVQKMVFGNFLVVWTTVDNKAIADWVDKDDKSHIPVIIVLDKDGRFLLRQKHLYGLDDTQKILAKVNAGVPK